MKLTVKFDASTTAKIIKEHHCQKFIFVLNRPRTSLVTAYSFTKEELLSAGTAPFKHFNNSKDYVNSFSDDVEIKRDEQHKPCLRFDTKWIIQNGHAEFTIKRNEPNFEKWLDSTREHALRKNAGCAIESMVCKKMGLTQIGEKDRQSHTRHCDALDEKNTEYEIKLQSGYMTSQFWKKGLKWE